MEWSDDAIILSVRRHGETSVVVEAMTGHHGRHLGLVRGGRSSKLRPVLQPGNGARVTWRARLDEHLGQYTIEPTVSRAGALMASAAGLYGLASVTGLVRLLPERDPHPGLYEALAFVVDALSDRDIAAVLLVRFELAVLAELGFGLDLDRCAATGTREDLAFVSPKTGRAVSRAAAGIWADRMLRLPAFLVHGAAAMPAGSDLSDAFALTGFFLDRHVYGPRGIRPPEGRAAFIRACSLQAESLEGSKQSLDL